MLEPRFVDTREPPARRLALQRAGFHVQTLDAGDIAFPEHSGEVVLVEHKTVSKLLEDMSSGVLLRQCRRISESTPYPILLIEGRWQQEGGKLLATSYTWQQAWNELQTLQDMGMRVQLATSPEHTLARILELAEYYAKPYHGSAKRGQAGDQRLAALNQIYGVGTAKGQALLTGFGSLAAIAEQNQMELSKVLGIGPVLALRIWQFFHLGGKGSGESADGRKAGRTSEANPVCRRTRDGVEIP